MCRSAHESCPPETATSTQELAHSIPVRSMNPCTRCSISSIARYDILSNRGIRLRFNVAVAQIKPKKGDYRHNIGRIGDLFEQVAGLTPRPDVLVLPETVTSGYFLEGGVREVAQTRDRLLADLQRAFLERWPTN